MSDELELPPDIQADVDQHQAAVTSAFPQLFDVDDCTSCAHVEPDEVCDYHQGVHDAIAAIVETIGTGVRAIVHAQEEAGEPICTGARAAFGYVGEQQLAWLQAAADRMGDGT